MYEQESAMLADAFNDLQANYNQANINAFLRACWLLPESRVLSYASLERLIYVEGDQKEIYTSRERQFIKAIKDDVYSCSFQVNAKSGVINSRIITIELGGAHSPIFEAIAIMKILNKALDGFNIFAFVSESGIYLGCSEFRSNGNALDCVISPPITESMDWDLLADVFLYREDSDSFYQYYHGLVTVFRAIGYCYKEEEKTSYVWESYGYGDDDYPDAYYDIYEHVKGGDYHRTNDEVFEQVAFDVDAFEREVEGCKMELDYIVSAHMNPLELLFEAEEALALAERQETNMSVTQPAEADDDLPEIALLDDPIALMKKLKQDRGLR